VLRYFTPKSASHRLLLIRVTEAEKKASLTEFGPCAWWCSLVHIHLITYLMGEISPHSRGDRRPKPPWWCHRIYPIMFSDADVQDYLQSIRRAALTVSDPPLVSGVVCDPSDDIILVCAIAAEASHVVTRDDDLLSIGVYEGVTIISPEPCSPCCDVPGDQGGSHYKGQIEGIAKGNALAQNPFINRRFGVSASRAPTPLSLCAYQFMPHNDQSSVRLRGAQLPSKNRRGFSTMTWWMSWSEAPNSLRRGSTRRGMNV
jgi:hypothetical protein